MKLYITAGSPYARIVRIVILEKRLQSRIEIIPAQTRLADSPYYRINPSGRVPYLIRDDGVGMEESTLICAYLDHLDGAPAFDLPAGEQAWDVRRLDLVGRGLQLHHAPLLGFAYQTRQALLKRCGHSALLGQ